MARTVRHSSLETRAVRSRLPASKKHWQLLEQGLHLGYRRGPRGGSWYARRFAGGRYAETTLGVADDLTDADHISVLSHRDAQKLAREWWLAEQRRERGVAGLTNTTVGQACDEYLAHYVARGGKAEYATRRAIDAHIRPLLGPIELSRLTNRTIREWLNRLASSDRRVRTKRSSPTQAVRPVDPADRDAKRARRASANRLLSVLKAILNMAMRDGLVDGDQAWKLVKPFPSSDAPVVRYLSIAECKRLTDACPGDLRSLVLGAIFTGARYGELCRLKPSDLDVDVGTIAIREAKAGKGRHVTLVPEAVDFFRAISSRGDRLFTRADGTHWKASQATRPLVEACKRANISPAISFHVLRHTHASALATNGVPISVIAAQLGHADTRVTERHYAHLSPSYITQTIRAQFPTIGFSQTTLALPPRQDAAE